MSFGERCRKCAGFIAISCARPGVAFKFGEPVAREITERARLPLQDLQHVRQRNVEQFTIEEIERLEQRGVGLLAWSWGVHPAFRPNDDRIGDRKIFLAVGRAIRGHEIHRNIWPRKPPEGGLTKP